LLEVDDLRVGFESQDGNLIAVDGVTFSVAPGRIVGLVGESGCGKSATALAIMRLLPEPNGKIVSGRILLDSDDLVPKSEKELRRIRGNTISMIFQEPMTSLNPVFTIGEQVAEVLRIHRALGGREAKDQAISLLEKVRIPAAPQRYSDYPHQLSGGMRQRVMIAMALACKPRVLIADEPTTALDVTIQAQILDLIQELRDDTGMGTLLITHDLGVVAEVCDELVVMYAGKIVESGPVAEVLENPAHPYTLGLLRSIPKLGQRVFRLPTIAGSVPALNAMPRGCRFQTRCELVTAQCRQSEPIIRPVRSGHFAACFALNTDLPGDNREPYITT
jgi:oligopeptide/dipeptide ABC transporter ATP-binding protein